MFFIFWQPLPAILLSRFQNQLRIKSLFIHAFFLKTVLFYGILLWRSFQSRIEVKYQLPSYTCSSVYDNENFFSCRTYCCTFDNFHTISNVNADAESRSRNRKIDFLQRQYEAVTDRSVHLSGYLWSCIHTALDRYPDCNRIGVVPPNLCITLSFMDQGARYP